MRQGEAVCPCSSRRPSRGHAVARGQCDRRRGKHRILLAIVVAIRTACISSEACQRLLFERSLREDLLRKLAPR